MKKKLLINIIFCFTLLLLGFTSCESDLPDSANFRKRIVPVEFISESSTHKYEYDDLLRLTKITFNQFSPSYFYSYKIEYNESKVYSISYNNVGEGYGSEDIYLFTYNKDTVFYKQTKSIYDQENTINDVSGYYVVDLEGKILKEYSHRYGWWENEKYSTFKYDNNGNLIAVKSDLGDNYLSIKASYDTQRGIMSDVNVLPWVLYFVEVGSPLDFSISNNVIKSEEISSSSKSKENITYTYQYNLHNLPESMIIDVINEYPLGIFPYTYNATIRYEERQQN